MNTLFKQGQAHTQSANDYRTAQVVAQDEALFAGLIPRGLRILGATFILSATKDVLIDKALHMKTTV